VRHRGEKKEKERKRDIVGKTGMETEGKSELS
jgi:hypothetical protein